MSFPGRSISITGCDSILKKKLELYGAREAAVQLFFTRAPDIEKDICIFPVEILPDYINDPSCLFRLKPPCIAYGPARAMAAAVAAGCSDYLCEPWEPSEFYVRILLCLRKTEIVLEGGYSIYASGGMLYCMNGEGEKAATESLSAAEYSLFIQFIRNRGRFFGRDEVASLLGREVCRGSRMADMHVSRLRRRLDSLTAGLGEIPNPIRTASGRGWGIIQQD